MGIGVSAVATVGAVVFDVGPVSAGGVVGGFGGRVGSGDGKGVTKVGVLERGGMLFGAIVGIFVALDGDLDGLGLGSGLSVGSGEALGCFNAEEGRSDGDDEGFVDGIVLGGFSRMIAST